MSASAVVVPVCEYLSVFMDVCVNVCVCLYFGLSVFTTFCAPARVYETLRVCVCVFMSMSVFVSVVC